MKPLLLIVDDDEKLNERLCRYLGKFGFRALSAAEPEEGLEMIGREDPDLVILDVMMPRMDGFELLRELRKTRDLPVIMLTARGEVSDRVAGLEMGADDYLPKPFEPRELVARIRNILRRRGSGKTPSSKSSWRFGPLKINYRKHSVTLEGNRIELTDLEFRILSELAGNPGVVMDRDSLMERTRGVEWEALDRSLDVLVSRLRQKLGDDPRKPRFIKTVWGSGYMFIGEEPS